MSNIGKESSLGHDDPFPHPLKQINKIIQTGPSIQRMWENFSITALKWVENSRDKLAFRSSFYPDFISPLVPSLDHWSVATRRSG